MAAKRKARENLAEILAKKSLSSSPCPNTSHMHDTASISIIGSLNESYLTCSSSMASTPTSNEEVFESFQSNKDTPKLEFPDTVNTYKFAESRVNELVSLAVAVKCKKPKRISQQLPKHMRRRAASHNANRIPRRLREKALREIEKAKKPSRPSRKHRRRPSNLLQEYNRRQRTYIWLETHIWFAKRFRMSRLFGYVLPLYPNDKSFRAGYRAVTRHVLIQDLSYLCCIQLQGEESSLLGKLDQIVDTSTGLTFAAKVYLSGTREGSIIVYDPCQFPYRALGPVSFLWQPNLEATSRKLWIWCHPLMHDKLVQIFRTIFDLPDDVPSQSSDTTETETNDASDLMDEKLPPQSSDATEMETNDASDLMDKKLSLRFKKLPCYSNNGISLTLLKDKLVRHRLIGPFSHSIILDTLKAAPVRCNLKPIIDNGKWWEEYYSRNENKIALDMQKYFWSKVQQRKSPDDLPPKIIIAATVRDPRLDLPKLRKKISCDLTDCKTVDAGISSNIEPEIAQSPLWDETIRDVVTATKIPESQLNSLRSQALVPGTRLELGKEEAFVPVIVIHQPGNNGFFSGWDIIAPLGWSMPFWIAFIYRGARAFGLRELRGMAKDVEIPIFPYSFPDTEFYQDMMEKDRKKLMTKHFRYPPSKRPNFAKLGILTPFYMPWETLVADWIKQLSVTKISSDTSDYFVLRSRKELKLLHRICKFLTCQKKNNIELKDVKSSFSELRTKLNETPLKHALVCVSLKCLQKGCSEQFSRIYMPNERDIIALNKSKKYACPVEPIHKIQKTEDAEKLKKSSKDHLIRPHIETLIDHCSHSLMGYVETGGYSSMNACGAGLGHCTLIAFVELLKKCFESLSSPVVLLRSQNSFCYKVAKISVVQNFL